MALAAGASNQKASYESSPIDCGCVAVLFSIIRVCLLLHTEGMWECGT